VSIKAINRKTHYLRRMPQWPPPKTLKWTINSRYVHSGEIAGTDVTITSYIPRWYLQAFHQLFRNSAGISCARCGQLIRPNSDEIKIVFFRIRYEFDYTPCLPGVFRKIYGNVNTSYFGWAHYTIWLEANDATYIPYISRSITQTFFWCRTSPSKT